MWNGADKRLNVIGWVGGAARYVAELAIKLMPTRVLGKFLSQLLKGHGTMRQDVAQELRKVRLRASRAGGGPTHPSDTAFMFWPPRARERRAVLITKGLDSIGIDPHWVRKSTYLFSERGPVDSDTAGFLAQISRRVNGINFIGDLDPFDLALFIDAELSLETRARN